MKIINCCCDWLEFSIFNDIRVGQEYDFTKVLQIFDLRDLQFEESKSFYYQSVYNYANMIFIYVNPKGVTKDTSHVHVKFTGKGCRFLEQKYVCDDIKQEVYARIASTTMKVSRMDIAIDYDEKFVNQFLSSAMNYSFTGFRSRKVIVEKSTTIYLGSKNSEKFFRMYEKDIESGDTKFKDRIELVLKNEYATNEFFNSNNLVNIISSYMALVSWNSEDIQNKWQELQTTLCKISKGIKHVKTTLREKVDYILETYGKTLKAGVEAFGAMPVLKYIHDSLISEKLNREIKLIESLRIYKQKRKIYEKMQLLYDKMYFKNDFVQVRIS